MMCGECDHVPAGGDEPNYCPNCGSEWRQKTLDDVDWPIEVQVGPRIDLNYYVREETGLEARDLWDFTDEAEMLVDIRINRDGTFEVVSER